MSSVVVFPTQFFNVLANVKKHTATSMEATHQLVTAYNPVFWASTLTLIPAHDDGDQWSLLVVCHLNAARAKAAVLPPCQTIEDGDEKPDSAKFTILSMTASGDSLDKHRGLVKRYLEWHYHRVHGAEMQYVDGWETPVRRRTRNRKLKLTSNLSVHFKSTTSVRDYTQCVTQRF